MLVPTAPSVFYDTKVPNPFVPFVLFVIPDPDVMAGWGEGVPGNVEPGGGGQELVGVFPTFEEVDELREPCRILRSDIGSLSDEVLRVAYTTHLAVHGLATETRIHDDGTHQEPRRLQQLMAAIGQIRHDLHRGDILWVLAQVEELAQLKMRR